MDALPICASVVATSADAARQAMARAAPACAWLELRLDAAPPGVLAPEALIPSAPRPVVATCRAAREGGGWTGTEEERRALLVRAARAGAAYLDVEWDAVAALPPVPCPLIVSRHPAREPAREELPALLASLRGPRAAVQKLAVPCSDAALALELLALAAREPAPTVAIAMGFAGVATRLAGALAGAPLLYAAAEPERPAAPGQLGAGEAADLLRGRRPGRGSALYGVVGRPVDHSRSPALHNAAFAALGVDAVYSWLETSDPAALLAAAARLEAVRGLSVTLPHKEAAARAPGVTLDPLAAAIGAVNTLVRTPGGWSGHNTDALAAEELVRAALRASGREPAATRAALLGSGGAARAVAHALARLGLAVTVFARDPARGRALAAAVGGAWEGPLAALPPGAFELIVNATSVGMGAGAEASPVAADAHRAGGIAYDLVYTPPDTRFLRDAAGRGAQVIDGLAHFALQARAQLELWLGGEQARALAPEWFGEALAQRRG